MQAFKLQLSALPCKFLKCWKITEITSTVEFLYYRSKRQKVLYRIAALNSFLENFQEDLQVYLKGLPPWMFCWEICKNFRSSCFFKIFSKHQWTDASENSESLFLEHKWTPFDEWIRNRREISICSKKVLML